ncbi:MAG: protein kinase, partial [Planctomycetes bacterium]|nr:protein kinase [Planctomycetota bacterium]
MIDTPNQPEPSREARLDRLIAQYLQGEEAGRPINPRELLQQSPELQADFYSFLKQHEELAPTLPNAPLKFGLAETMPRGVQQGQVLGDCHLVRELGRGGMGVVYLGRHVRLDALRAVKVLPRENVSDDAIARFWREAQTAAKIDHLNVVAVHDVGRQGDVHYIVMQYINGETLAQVLDRHAAQSDGAPFPWQTALRLAHPVLDALATMHAQGLIHRDIKPSNIMATEKSSVTKRKHVVVMDFGLVRDDSEARLTATGGVVGTPAYMSPEQARGLTVDARTDVYAVGATLYSLLAGRPPFDGQRGVVFRQLVSGKRPLPLGSLRPDLPESVCKLVERAMAPELGERFSRAGEMLKDIEDLLRKAPKADARRPHPTPSFPASSAPSAPARGAPVASPAHQDTVSGAGDTGEDLASFVPWKPVPELTASPSSASGSQCTETFSRGSSRTQGKNFFASIPPLPVALAMLLIVVGGAWMFSLDGKDDPAPVKGAAPETPSPAATARPAPDRERMVYIPPGPAWLGASEARLRSHAQGLASLTGNPQAVDDFVEACLREPAQTVSLKGFWIDKYEVTNAQYARFVKATGHAPPS